MGKAVNEETKDLLRSCLDAVMTMGVELVATHLFHPEWVDVAAVLSVSAQNKKGEAVTTALAVAEDGPAAAGVAYGAVLLGRQVLLLTDINGFLASFREMVLFLRNNHPLLVLLIEGAEDSHQWGQMAGTYLTSITHVVINKTSCLEGLQRAVAISRSQSKPVVIRLRLSVLNHGTGKGDRSDTDDEEFLATEPETPRTGLDRLSAVNEWGKDMGPRTVNKMVVPNSAQQMKIQERSLVERNGLPLREKGPAAVSSYLNKAALPTKWCPGCGHGIVLGMLARSLEQISSSPADFFLVTGEGCIRAASSYLNIPAISVPSGMTLAVARGLQAADNRLKVVVLEENLFEVSRNIVFAARRRENTLVVAVNKFGNDYNNSLLGDFDLPLFAKAAGAKFVGYTTVYHVRELQRFLIEALSRPGFALLEVSGICPAAKGGEDPSTLMARLRDRSVSRRYHPDTMSGQDMLPAEFKGYGDEDEEDY